MAKQLTLKRTSGWGGKRRGAGRPNRSKTVNHMRRARVNLKIPLHVTLRLKEKLPTLRREALFREFKKSLALAKEQGLYVIHFSIQRNHIHLFCEAESNRAISLGMRSLAGRFAKEIRKHIASRGGADHGSVFEGRYHLRPLKTPYETRNALEYVLLNTSKHQNLIEYVDTYSSGFMFHDWRKLLGSRFRSILKSQVEFDRAKMGGIHGGANDLYSGTRDLHASMESTYSLSSVLSPPRSWLAVEGWMRAHAD